MFGQLFFYVIGVYAFLWWFIDNFKSLFAILWSVLMSYVTPDLYPPLNEKFGNWAVVTGSTDGIGKEYAKQLAQRGINIVLIARNEAKLIATATEIEAAHPVHTKYIVADFSNGKEIYNRIKNEINVPVGILVNNVGCMYEYPEELGKVPEETIWTLLMTNVCAVTMMTRLIVNDMKQRKKGVIVNVSSGTHLQPAPYACVYAATKSYTKSFTLALQTECQPYGVKVQLLSPYFVSTKLNSYSKDIMSGNLFVPDVQTYGRWAVFTLGKTYETTGYWSHAVQFAASKMVPVAVRTFIGTKIAKHFRNEYFQQHAQPQNNF